MNKKNVTLAFAAIAVAVTAIAGTVQARFEPQKPVVEKPKPKLYAVSNCEEGQQHLFEAGFTHVFAMDCDGVQFRYNAFRGKHEVIVTLSAVSGGYAAVSKNSKIRTRKN